MRRPFNRALHATLSGWLVGMLAVGPAAAQQQHVSLRLMPRTLPAAAGPRVAVVAIPVDASLEGEALALTHWAEQAVARSGRLELVRLADALDAQGASTRQEKAVEGNASFKEGAKAYDELDTVKALQSFDKAVRAYEQSDLSRAFPLLSRARVMKAATQVANGENKAAELEMRAVLAVDPRATFNPNYFPPETMAFVEKERKAQLDGAQATLHLRTQPGPAQVFVDGTYRGVSPLELTGLTRADHYVTLVAPGYGVMEGRAREGEASFTLTKLPVQQRYAALVERIAKNPDGEERDQALQELGVLAGVPQVLALMVRGGPGNAPLTVTGLRMDVADGHNQAYALGQVPRGDAMATGSEALLTGLVAQDAARVNGKPVKHFSSGGVVSRRTAGYVLLATGVALLAGGIYFGLEASSKADAFKTAPQGSSRADDLKSTGKTYALVADIGVLAGLVSAGAGSYLAFYKKGGGSSSSAPATSARAAPAAEAKPMDEALPMPPPPAAKTEEPAPKANATSTPAPEPAPETTPPPPIFEPPPQPPPSQPAKKMTRKEREAEARRQREEAARLKHEEERRQKEEEARRKQEEEAKRKAEEEAKRKAEEEARRKREEEKKRPKLDEDDLRNY